MHRSGTSALSGLLHTGEVYFGSSIAPPSYDNPKGYYENYKIQNLNDRILKSLNRKWDTPGLLSKSWLALPEVEKYHDEALGLVKKEFGSQPLFAIKDPRICLLFPFWENVLLSLNISIKCILTLRNPAEIAASLKKRNFFSINKSYLLTSAHLLSAEVNTRSLIRAVISYDQLLDDPIKVLRYISRQLDIDLPFSQLHIEEYRAHISPNLRTHHSTESRKSEVVDERISVSNIHEKIRSLADSTINLSGVHAALDQHYVNFSRLTDATLSSLIGPKKCYGKLLIDNGQGYYERNSIAKKVIGSTEDWYFSLKEYPQPIKALKLMPANAPCTIVIRALNIDYTDDEGKYKLSENSDFRKDDILYFNDEFATIIFEFEYPISVDGLSISIEYLSIGATQKPDKEKAKASQLPIWLQFILATLRRPHKVLSKINRKNLRTLRYALRRESPVQILRNFKKLLSRSENQEAIQERATKGQEKYLSKGTTPDLPKVLKRDIAKRKNTGARATALNLLYVMPELPDYDKSSGGRRASRLLELMSREHNVYLYALHLQDDKYLKYIEERCITVIRSKNTNVKRELPKADFIIFSFYFTYYDASFLHGLYPDARVIIDSVDINWVKEFRAIGTWEGITKQLATRNKNKEIEAYKKADIVWVVTDADRDALIQEIPNTDVQIISNIHELHKKEYSYSGNNNLLFFGGYNYYANVSAVLFLANEIFPAVRRMIPQARLLIAGSNAPEEVATLGELEGVEYLGFIEEGQIDQLYATATLSVAPLLSGAGIKGKICEAISYYMPVVTNEIGNEGIGLVHGESGLINDDLETFSDTIIEALNGQYDLASIASNAASKLDALVGPERALDNVGKSLFRPVSICIVTWNRIELLKSCIDSIINHTIYPFYRIIVYSNGCTDGTQEYLTELSNQEDRIEIILSDKNDVFVLPNNKMMDLHPDDDIVLLNNDVMVHRDWLCHLYKSAYSIKAVGIVGSKILYPDGTLQEYGSEIYEDGSGQNIGKHEDPHQPEFTITKAAGYVSGCAMYIKRSTISKIGLLDPAYHPCYYEDSDYCYRAWDVGLYTIVSPDSIVYHLEGGTAGTEDQKGMKQYQHKNRHIFVEKHQKKVKRINKSIRKVNKQLFKNSS